MTRDVLNLRRLVYSIRLAEELHSARAASRLNIAQPALSQQIVKLENELGVRLLERTKRTVRLTDAGSALLVDARLLVAQSEQIACRACGSVLSRRGRMTCCLGSFDVFEFVARMLYSNLMNAALKCPSNVSHRDRWISPLSAVRCIVPVFASRQYFMNR